MEGGSNYETLFVCICTGQLSPDDLALVYGEVMSARSNWFNFGLELGLEVYELKEIERDNPHSTDRCFINCLEMWLRGSHQPPTWSAVVEALRSPTVGHDGLADRIEEKYIMTEGEESIILLVYLHKHSLSKFALCGIDLFNCVLISGNVH